MFIPRLTREMTNSSSPAQYVYEAVTMQSGSLSSMDGVTDGSTPRYFLDISAAEAFSQESGEEAANRGRNRRVHGSEHCGERTAIPVVSEGARVVRDCDCEPRHSSRLSD
jgi:hypothetical protein